MQKKFLEKFSLLNLSQSRSILCQFVLSNLPQQRPVSDKLFCFKFLSFFSVAGTHTLSLPLNFPLLSIASLLKHSGKSVVCFKRVEKKCEMSYYGIAQSRTGYQAPLGARSSSAPSYERTPLSRSGSHNNVYSRGGSIAPTANASSYYNSATNFEVLSVLC